MANQKNTSPKISFKRADVENDLDMAEEFDVVIMIYGWQWFQSLDKAAIGISRAMKKGGIIISASYMESNEYFEARRVMTQKEEWKDRFGTEIVPYIFETSTYL